MKTILGIVSISFMSINLRKTILITTFFSLFLILLGIGIYFYQLRNKPKELIHGFCLSDDEFADYPINEKYAEEIKVPKIPLVIFVKDEITKEQKFSFQIENVDSQGVHLQLHKCGVYVIRKFNYDPRKTKQDPGYKAELWRYDYKGNGEFMLLFHEKIGGDTQRIYKSYYALDFLIAPNEKYIALDKLFITEFEKGGYLGGEDNSLVIQDLKTREDVFVLPISDLLNKYPSLEGNVSLIAWTQDSRYFWGETFIAAYNLGFFRIDTTNWDVEIFELPDTEFHKGVLGGDALNIEKGYVTRHPDYIWIGIQEDYEQIKKEWQEQGKTSSLYLYHLLTKEETLLATTSEPLWFFNPKWLSDTELEYELPSGERKVYNIDEK